VSLSPSANPTSPGATVQLSAHVTAGQGTPTGTVTFIEVKQGIFIFNTILGTSPLDSSGNATISHAFAQENYAIVAVYSGDTQFRTRGSAVLALAVGVP